MGYDDIGLKALETLLQSLRRDPWNVSVSGKMKLVWRIAYLRGKRPFVECLDHNLPLLSGK